MLRNLTCGNFELRSSSLLLRRQESEQLRRMLSRFIQEEVGFLPCNRLSSIREQGSATKPRVEIVLPRIQVLRLTAMIKRGKGNQDPRK